MAESVGALQVDVTANTSALVGQIATKSTAAGTAAGAGMGKGMIGGFAALGVGAVITAGVAKSINAAGLFEQQMDVIAAASGAGAKGMENLSNLALKMGADTVFSAGEAADAMLELVKSGLTPAEVRAGALQQALNLAATEGIGMADAATIMANALNTYGLAAKDSQQVSDALAGAATASSASVTDISMALSQVGPSAVTAGLSIQDTTAALAAFADQGIRGSDAGTSLKTFLMRLVPATDRAATGLSKLGLDATKSDGSFRSLRSITEQLTQGTSKLTAEQRSQYMNMAFGSDASRAAIVFSKLGAKGLDEYTKATNKAGSAQTMAEARMQGYAGAMESFKGSIETLAITVGTALLPVATEVVKVLTSVVNWLGQNEEAMLVIAGVIGGAVLTALAAYTVSMISAAAATIAATWPILAVIAGIGLLVGAFIWAYNNVEWFATGVQMWMKIAGAWFSFLWRMAKAVFTGIVNAVRATVSFFQTKVVPAFMAVARFVIAAFKMWTAPIRFAIALVWAVVSWLISKLRGPLAAVFGFIVGVVRSAVSNVLSVWRGLMAVYTFIKGVFDKVREGISNFVGPIIDRVTGFIDDFTQPFQDLVGDAVDWGKDLIQGFWEGIQSMGSMLWDNITGFIEENVPGPVLKVLDMGSPSKLFRQYGKWTAEGMALGLDDGAKGVHDAAARMVPKTRISNPGWSATQPGGLTAASQGRGEIHVYVGDREITDIVRVEQAATRRRDQLDLAWGRV